MGDECLEQVFPPLPQQDHQHHEEKVLQYFLTHNTAAFSYGSKLPPDCLPLYHRLAEKATSQRHFFEELSRSDMSRRHHALTRNAAKCVPDRQAKACSIGDRFIKRRNRNGRYYYVPDQAHHQKAYRRKMTRRQKRSSANR